MNAGHGEAPGGDPERAYGEWPLVGREGELRLLAGLLTRPDAGGIVLAGPPGVGKTRLAAAGLALAEEAGLPTARVTATRAASGLPFGALQPLLPAAAEEPPVYQAELLRRAAAALAERGGERRLVLMIDNANVLDEASAALVHQLAATGTALLLITLRAREPAPQTVVALWKDGLVERLDVEGLDGEAVEELLFQVLGDSLDPAAVACLAARSQGNLLFLRELVLGAVQAGVLVNDAGLWRLVTPPAPSQRLVELIEARLARLDAEERGLLEAVAVGEPLGTAELDALGDPGRSESLETQGLVAGRPDGRRLEFRLHHPLYGEVLRGRISTLRRRAVARVLAETVEAAGARRSDDHVRVTTWRLDSGGAAPDRLLSAAETVRRGYDLALAERLARGAVAAGAGFPARVMAAQLAGLQGREIEAETELSALVGRDDDERALLTVVRLDNLRYLGRLEEALSVATKAEAEVAPGPGRDEIEARRAGLILDLEGPAAAAEAAEALRARATGGAFAWACLISAFALARCGRVGQAEEAAASGHASHVELGPALPWPAAALILARADALVADGRLVEAETVVQAEYRQALGDGLINTQAYTAWQLAKVTVAQGRVEAATRYGREAVALLRSLGRRSLLRDALVPLALAEALAGRARAAAEVLAQLDSLRLSPSCWTYADLLQARAWSAVAAGDLPAARGILEEAAEWGQGVGDRLGVVSALHDLARLGRAKEVERRLRQAASGVEGNLTAARAAHVAALAQGDAAELERVSADFESCGAWLLAADAAVAWRRAGSPRAAVTAEQLAEARAARCEGAVTPALRALEVRAVLTPAEREAALLAVTGRSNRQIAAELGLSVRTVENRLQRIYDKLAVSGRVELSAAMER